MRRLHIFLLVITALVIFFSAYSLTALNQIFQVNFEWYSQYYDKYSNESRNTLKSKWQMEDYPGNMILTVLDNKAALDDFVKTQSFIDKNILKTDFNRFVLLYCTFGEVYSPEYRIKIIDIAQRGNVVEVKLDVNSPVKLNDSRDKEDHVYLPRDIARIDRKAFPVRGKLVFMFKRQDGNQISENYFDIKER